MTPPAAELLLPPNRFYWAILDVAPLGSTRGRVRRHQRLTYAFEAVVPVPIEQVHAVFAPLSDSSSRTDNARCLACGIDIDDLQREIHQRNHSLSRLGPSSVPDFIQAETCNTIDPQSLNLLHGRFEPSHVAQLRRRWMGLLLITLGCCSFLVSMGFEARAADNRHAGSEARIRRAEVCASVLDRSATLGDTDSTMDLALIAELRRLRQTRQQPINGILPVDCTPLLAALLEAWPDGDNVHPLTDAISVTQTSVTVRATLATSQDAQIFISALRTFGESPLLKDEAWHMLQPHLQAAKDSVQVTLQWKLPKVESEP